MEAADEHYQCGCSRQITDSLLTKKKNNTPKSNNNNGTLKGLGAFQFLLL